MRDVINFIEKYNNFIIIGHKDPDFDCIGSSLALSSFLSRIGKNSVLLNEGPFVRKEIIPFKDKFYLNGLILIFQIIQLLFWTVQF